MQKVVGNKILGVKYVPVEHILNEYFEFSNTLDENSDINLDFYDWLDDYENHKCLESVHQYFLFSIINLEGLENKKTVNSVPEIFIKIIARKYIDYYFKPIYKCFKHFNIKPPSACDVARDIKNKNYINKSDNNYQNEYLYIIHNSEYYKIGISSDPENRLKALQTSSPYELKLIKVYECKNSNKIESLIHAKLKHKNIRGEWFDLSNDDIKEIDILIKSIIDKEATDD